MTDDNDNKGLPPDVDPTGALDTLDKVVAECMKNRAFMAEFDRMHGSSFTKPGLVQAIDIATGKRAADEDALRRFIADVVIARMKAMKAKQEAKKP